MKINHKQIKTISINMNTGSWNADTHNILLTKDTSSDLGFSIKFIKIIDDVECNDLTLSNDILNKFKLNQ